MSKYLNLIFGDELTNELTGLNIDNLGLDFTEIVGEDKTQEINNLSENNPDKTSKIQALRETVIENIKAKKNSLGLHLKGKEPLKSKSKNNLNLNAKYNKLVKANKDEEDLDLANLEVNAQKQKTDDDLNLELLSIENKQKVFRLTDLYIPMNNKLARKIEKYNMMIINDIEKNEVDEKKEEQEEEEVRNQIRKAKKIQKYIKVNYSYNEKFFDKTFFLDNYTENTNQLLNQGTANLGQLLEQEEMRRREESEQEVNCRETYYNEYRQGNKNPFFFNYSDERKIYNDLDLKEDNRKDPSSRNDSLCIKRPRQKLNQEVSTEFPPCNDLFDDYEALEGDQFRASLDTIQKQSLRFYESQMMQSLNEVLTNYNKGEEEDYYEFLPKEKMENTLEAEAQYPQEPFSMLQNHQELRESLIKSGLNKQKDEEEQSKSSEKNDDQPTQEQYGSLVTKSLSTEQDDYLLQPLANDELELSIRKLYNIRSNQLSLNLSDNSAVAFNSNNPQMALNDFLKKKRYKYPTNPNPEISSGRFVHSILIDEDYFDSYDEYSICLNNFKLYSQKVFDLSDYNMVFEYADKKPGSSLPNNGNSAQVNSSQPATESNQPPAKDQALVSLRKKSDDLGLTYILPSTNIEGEQHFSNFLRRIAISSYSMNPSNNQKLKIVKSKNSAITHSKCAYSLNYNKINLSMDELKNFHRPDFTKFLYNLKRKTKSSVKLHNLPFPNSNYSHYEGQSKPSTDSFKPPLNNPQSNTIPNINTNTAINNNTHKNQGPGQSTSTNKIKSWPVVIRTRKYLKDKEKRRIQKNIQYMNAYEVFKNHQKLSLNEGKFALFEHIDEEPLLINNYGMASRLKKFLYTNKLFNCYNNSSNISKLTEGELKTLNLIGPNGVQIPLQPSQKLPLLGQLDKTDLKGLAVIDNKMFKAPVFYEKYKPQVFVEKERKNKDRSNINNIRIRNNGDDINNNGDSMVRERKNSENYGKENRKEKNRRDTHYNIKLRKKNSTRNSNEWSVNQRSTAESTTITTNTNNDVTDSVTLLSHSNTNTNLSTAPNLNSGSRRMQFLIVFKKKPAHFEPLSNKDDKNSAIDQDSAEKFYIRELEHMYLVGQEEPKIMVYPPQSKDFNNYLKKKIHTYVDRIYNEVDFRAGINFKFFSNLFPNVTEQILKKYFKELGIEIDKNICFYNPSKSASQRHENIISPENICQYESSQYGMYRLRQVGIRNLTNSDKISYATNKLITTIKDSKQQFLAKVAEEEILTTPWNLTMNYIQSKQTNGMLSIKGIGDPSNGNGGYSFIKMPVKQYNTENKTLKEQIDQLKEQNKNIKSVTGTDADLRKLPKHILKMKLLQIGEDEEYINKMSRWERVALLRFKSSKAAELGYEGDITKYARGDRIGTSMQKETYQNNINEVFKNFIDYVSSFDQYYVCDPALSAPVCNASSTVLALDANATVNEDLTIRINTDSKKIVMNNTSSNSIPPLTKHKSIASLASFHSSINEHQEEEQNNTDLVLQEPQPIPLDHLESGYFEEGNEEITLYDKTQNLSKLDRLNSTYSALSKKKKKLSRHNSMKSDKLLKLYTKEGEETNKIKLEMKSDVIELIKQKRRRNQGFDKFYEYEDPTRNSTVRRRFQVERKLNEILEDIVDSCIRFDKSKLFHSQVKKKDFPDYCDKVKNPIDMNSIKNKTKRNEYADALAFEKDFEQMLINSEIYNGDDTVSPVTRQARLILDFASERLREKKKDIENEMEKKHTNPELKGGNGSSSSKKLNNFNSSTPNIIKN